MSSSRDAGEKQSQSHRPAPPGESSPEGPCPGGQGTSARSNVGHSRDIKQFVETSDSLIKKKLLALWEEYRLMNKLRNKTKSRNLININSYFYGPIRNRV